MEKLTKIININPKNNEKYWDSTTRFSFNSLKPLMKALKNGLFVLFYVEF
jgi:hypothetical protein